MREYLLPVFAYLLGSVSFAILVARLFHLEDPRHTGSKNPGATNILRYGGKAAAVATLAGDILKGVVAVLAARAFSDSDAIIALSMFGVFAGHLFPVFHGFKGGKGVATAFGALAALDWRVGIGLVVVWLVMALAFRYSSLSALAAAIAAPLLMTFLNPGPAFLYSAATATMSALLIWRHRSNIRNLLAGREGKIGA
jgi:glycerol-3-phosphate acyltransferase PlsY